MATMNNFKNQKSKNETQASEPTQKVETPQLEETAVEQKAQNEEVKAAYMKVAPTKSLRIRKEASLESACLGLMDPGEQVMILDASDSDFYKIKNKDKIVGYCLKKFLV